MRPPWGPNAAGDGVGAWIAQQGPQLSLHLSRDWISARLQGSPSWTCRAHEQQAAGTRASRPRGSPTVASGLKRAVAKPLRNESDEAIPMRHMIFETHHRVCPQAKHSPVLISCRLRKPPVARSAGMTSGAASEARKGSGVTVLALSDVADPWPLGGRTLH